jgi:pimeloyl-ACP methyl ester carboxylesterase
MSAAANSEYASLSRPEVAAILFHPRPESGAPSTLPASSHVLSIDVSPDVRIGARFHAPASKGASILFFHGNGEIAADYDDLALMYNELRINFLAVDYRGYGQSDGTPGAGTMLADSHVILDFTRAWLRKQRFNGPLIIMGRSLGSAPALELAAAHAGWIDGLIIESGFAYTLPLLRLLGADTTTLALTEAQGFRNREKIAAYAGDTLIMHAEFDHIIPYSDAQALYAASQAENKRLLKIRGADHNDILARAMTEYMAAIKRLVGQCHAALEG